jgi:uncharacterized protein (DUF1501 family)
MPDSAERATARAHAKLVHGEGASLDLKGDASVGFTAQVMLDGVRVASAWSPKSKDDAYARLATRIADKAGRQPQ